MAPEITIVIVSHNTKDLLADCLKSVYASQGVGEPEVIVVDNASGDGSTEMVIQDFQKVRLVANKENRGFAAANNQGLSHSDGDYVLLLNPDTKVEIQTIAILRKFLIDHPQAGLVGPSLIYPDGRFQHAAFHFPTLTMVFFDFFLINRRLIDSHFNGRYPQKVYALGEPFSIDHPLGAAMMIRHEVLEKVGLLDEGFFMYCEEIDWCMRIKAVGWGIFCQPRARIAHYVAQATAKNWGPNFVALHRSRYRLYAKHYSPLFRKTARFLVGLGIRREMAKALSQARRGEIDEKELRARLSTYEQVLALE